MSVLAPLYALIYVPVGKAQGTRQPWLPIGYPLATHVCVLTRQRPGSSHPVFPWAAFYTTTKAVLFVS